MPARLYLEQPLQADSLISLPPGPARHVQVLRLQPGAEITLFNGQGGEWRATVQQMGRSDVQVQLHAHDPVDRELPYRITLAIGMPANERMDALVEKATELGVASIQPLVTERSVLKLKGERADKKLVHWQSIAVAACEQCGRNRVPVVHALVSLADWEKTTLPDSRLLLSLQPHSQPLQLAMAATANRPVILLSGPEGGLTPTEEAIASNSAFVSVSLGQRTLRAETAPLAALAALTLLA